MATYHSESPTYITPPESQTHLYGNHHFSPVSSTSPTPTNVSPTSPRHSSLLLHLPLATRQLHPPKSPMYVPAVLRPTERPYRPSPLTPPRSVHGSTDSLLGDHGSLPQSRTSAPNGNNEAESERDPQGEILLEELGEVTGMPTREHWKPDANATICDAPICHKSFNLFERRHHCRRCGHVFCNSHSHHIVPLDQDAEFHPNGIGSRACKHCWDQYRLWKANRSSRTNSISSGNLILPGTPAIGMAKGRDTLDEQKSPVANSVPRDWNWSTF
ncbi:hypothetical protein MMC14_000493 [Varicellaria rhodocarpa]|nr:hypothetical protein [Varicellaria rhodocarpa]